MSSRLVHRKTPSGVARVSARVIAEIPVQCLKRNVPNFKLKPPASMISRARGSLGSKIARLSRIFAHVAENNSTVLLSTAAKQSGLTTDAVKEFARQFKQQTGIEVLAIPAKKQKN